MNFRQLNNIVDKYQDTPKMPILFLGHGSPMNAIEQNDFTNSWQQIAKKIPQPNAIICISAHWETRGTYLTSNINQKTIHDFYGFPKELYEYQYPAHGAPTLIDNIIKNNNTKHIIEKSEDWGIDHGTWSVLKYFYPNANIPTIQLSHNRHMNPQEHYMLGKELSYLREKGVLIVGSGNMIHNLRMVNLQNNDFNVEYGYEWAFEINHSFKKEIRKNNPKRLINYSELHTNIKLAIPTEEHYLPLLYILGMRLESDSVSFYNDRVIAGSLSMTSVLIE